MLALAGTAPVKGSDVVVAFVGGTLLAAAITRPRVAWKRGLKPPMARRLEAGITAFAFFVGGYATATLLEVLTHHVDKPARLALKGAAALLVLYGLLVHHEPFTPAGGDGAGRWKLLARWSPFVLVVIGFSSLGLAVGYLATSWGDRIDWIATGVGASGAAAGTIAFLRVSKPRSTVTSKRCRAS